MKQLKRIVIIFMCFTLLFPCNVMAHSGRTDSNGGHRDNKNASGLGSYHYHCGGNPPHLHEDGICPYSSLSSTSSSSKTTSSSYTKKVSKYYQSSIVKKVQKKLNKLGYDCGKADGIYGTKTKNAIEDFQYDNGMTVDGKIKKTLLKKLKINI